MPFPTFKNHGSVTCFSCRQVIEGEAKVSGYGLKHGEYVKQCKCGLSTWYDISGSELKSEREAQVQAVQVEIQEFAVHGRHGYQGGPPVPMTSSLCKLAPASPPDA